MRVSSRMGTSEQRRRKKLWADEAAGSAGRPWAHRRLRAPSATGPRGRAPHAPPRGAGSRRLCALRARGRRASQPEAPCCGGRERGMSQEGGGGGGGQDVRVGCLEARGGPAAWPAPGSEVGSRPAQHGHREGRQPRPGSVWGGVALGLWGDPPAMGGSLAVTLGRPVVPLVVGLGLLGEEHLVQAAGRAGVSVRGPGTALSRAGSPPRHPPAAPPPGPPAPQDLRGWRATRGVPAAQAPGRWDPPPPPPAQDDVPWVTPPVSRPGAPRATGPGPYQCT